MSGVIDNLICPNCGQEATYDMGRFSEHIYCANCGYSREMFITNADGIGQEGWIPETHIVENAKPFGAYYVTYKEGHSDAGSLIDETSEGHLMDEIEKYREEIVYAHIKEYINGEHKTRVIIDETQNRLQ
jgi:ribosomal protein S27AE